MIFLLINDNQNDIKVCLCHNNTIILSAIDNWLAAIDQYCVRERFSFVQWNVYLITTTGCSVVFPILLIVLIYFLTTHSTKQTIGCHVIDGSKWAGLVAWMMSLFMVDASDWLDCLSVYWLWPSSVIGYVRKQSSNTHLSMFSLDLLASALTGRLMERV